MKFCVWWVIIFLLLSCVSLKKETHNIHTLSKSDSINIIKETDASNNNLDNNDEQISEELIEDILGKEFCYDDIYTSYLQHKFYEQNYSQRKKEHHKLKQKELNAQSLFYARSILLGPSDSKFGGIPVISHPKIDFWINYYQTKGRQTFIQWLIRAQSFKEIVIPLLQKEGMPKDLFFLAMIESGFNNVAYSRKKATGTWQFMKGTAKLYNLTINYWVDERKDPIKSTIAAARYLRDLYIRFEDWYLAMAAYNAGEGKIARAIKLAKTKDFWKIAQTNYIRSETKNYVPKILAALAIASEPKKFGFDFTENPQDKIPQTTVDVVRPISLKELAQKLNISYNIIKKWNPELKTDITPPLKNNNSYQLRLSSNLIDKFNEIKNTLSKINISDVMVYNVKKGDNLYSISKKFKISISDILKYNPNLKPKTLKIGTEIILPIPTIAINSKTFNPNKS